MDAVRHGRIELTEEQRNPLRFVGLTDGCGHLAKAAQATEEPVVRVVGPAHVARAAPAIGTQRIQPAVVPATPDGDALIGKILGVAPR